MRRFVSAVALLTLLLAVPPASGETGKSVLLVLDASGSMNGQLPDGTLKITAAKAAVATVVDSLPQEIRLGFRAYGHQSPREERDCRDTELLVGFGELATVRDRVLEASRGLRARGYTPITHVIELAANDIAAEDGDKLIILVSDGKETCDGDPCATARALRAAGAQLVMHAVGFGVDQATRFQLRCVADATGGSYFDAGDEKELVEAIDSAAAAESKRVIVIEQERPGRLEIRNADDGHLVTDAETGEEVARLSKFRTATELPAGVYNVTFANSVWKSVLVKPGETTTLVPGQLEVRNLKMGASHEVLDAETRRPVATVSSLKSRITVLPSTFAVVFFDTTWENVVVEAGATTTLEPGVIRVTGAGVLGHPVRDAGGRVVVTISSILSAVPLPPGDYELDLGGRKVPIALAAGETVEIQLK